MDKWEKLGWVAAIFNPIPTGLLAGYYLAKEKQYRNSGRTIIVFSLVWTLIIVSITLFSWASIQNLVRLSSV
jgi:hypothetical protein